MTENVRASFLASEAPRIALFGMSGTGKTYLARRLRKEGWFHYSVDYRIGTRYLGEEIGAALKQAGMAHPYLRPQLLSDSISLEPRLAFDNLGALSAWLGMPGSEEKGGLALDEYEKRLGMHREAEIAATMDIPLFMQRAREIYGYTAFIADLSGSFCEIVNPADPADPVLAMLLHHVMPVYIVNSREKDSELQRRFDRAPKPIYYPAPVIRALVAEHMRQNSLASPAEIDPHMLAREGLRLQMQRRRPIYEAIARHGLVVTREEVAATPDAMAFIALLRGKLAGAPVAG